MLPLARALLRAKSPLRPWLCLLALALSSACAATPNEAANALPTGPARVRFVDYRQGNAFELVNDSHTDRVKLYSEMRADSSIKVASDEVMSALLEFLQDSGFHRYARSGVAPRTSSTQRWAGEVEVDGATVFVIVDDLTPATQRKVFLNCYMNHVTLWSNIFQLQRVNAGAAEMFKKTGSSR